MRRAVSFAVVVLCVWASDALLPFANAQTGAIQVWGDPIRYSKKATSLQSVDFRNLSYKLGGNTIALKGGALRLRYAGFGGINAQLEQTWLFDVQKGVPRHALISINVETYGGSSSPNGYVLLFEIRDGWLVATQEFAYNAQALGTGASFDVSGGKLTIIGRSDEDTPNCCPAHLDVATFAWSGDRFLPAGYTVIPATKN
jgi:hypothetical protein